MRSFLALSILVPLALAAGCAPAEVDDEAIGSADQRQVVEGPGARVVRLTFTDHAHTPFAEIQIVSTATSQHQPGIEYWYVNRGAAGLLGSVPLDAVTVDLTADPPDPDYPDEQRFTQIEYPTSGWGTGWTSDPLSFGTLLGDGAGQYLRLSVTRSGDVSRVAWYQVIAMTNTPAYLTPSGRFSSVTGISVGSGFRGYAIDQTVP
ncbi:Hypothetical protein A7982_01154 [Minicystis rosea]|nr:Hypothetical protein A7982_01154 [Minicystis rosea]